MAPKRPENESKGVAMINRGFAGRFEPVADDAIVATEGLWHDVDPNFDRRRFARIPLVEKRPD